MTNSTLFDIAHHTTSNTLHFRHQTTGTKNKCIDRVYIKVIDRTCRIRDRMEKNDYEATLIIVLVGWVTHYNGVIVFYFEYSNHCGVHPLPWIPGFLLVINTVYSCFQVEPATKVFVNVIRTGPSFHSLSILLHIYLYVSILFNHETSWHGPFTENIEKDFSFLFKMADNR